MVRARAFQVRDFSFRDGRFVPNRRNVEKTKIRIIVVLAGIIALAFSLKLEARGEFTPAYADRSPASAQAKQNSGYVVIQVDPEQPMDAFKEAGYKVISSDEFYATNPWQEPSPALREKIFKAAKLEREVAKWDHFDRDMLFLSAQDMEPAELQKQYSRLPASKLNEMQKIIRKEKGGKP